MKKSIVCFGLIIITGALISCKKDKNDTNSTDYYVSAKMNGTQKNFNSDATAVSLHISTTYSLNITAYGDAEHKEIFILGIQQPTALSAGTYSNGGGSALVLGGYNQGTTDQSLVYNTGNSTSGGPGLKIIISKITSANISGTFSGTFYDHGGDGPGILAITEGKFNLPVY